ncbi:Chloride channel protein CLC-d [Arachis hypogaea]|nr:Chloride channel protein CLC-d [Arachis hypogaea]
MASYSLSGISLVNRLWIRNPQSLALCLSHHQHIGMASYSLSAAVSLSRKPSFDSEHSIVAVSPSIGTVSTEHSILNWKDSAGNTILHRATLNDNNQEVQHSTASKAEDTLCGAKITGGGSGGPHQYQIAVGQGWQSGRHRVLVKDSAAAGSGIPEIKGYLNGVDIGFLLLRTLIGKIFGSIGSVGGGLALGKEGPLVHTGACIASLLGQVLRSARDRRDLVTCGCAAGVAAAFRAPVGGVLFALEEVTSWWRNQLMWRVFFTSAIVAVVVRTAMGWCKNGNCGYFGSGRFIIWDIYQSKDLCFYLFHCQLSIKVLFLSSSLDWFYF